MRAHHRPQHHEGLHEAVQACLTLGSRWVGPTLGEFIERAEHEFGADRSLAARMLTGLGPGDASPRRMSASCAINWVSRRRTSA